EVEPNRRQESVECYLVLALSAERSPGHWEVVGATVHNFKGGFQPPVTINLPSGVNWTSSAWSPHSYVARRWPRCASHSLAVPSWLPEARTLPSGDQHTLNTGAVCPWRFFWTVPWVQFQILTSWSLPPVASTPSAEKASPIQLPPG